jgi:type VI protein secretion system component Hcp
MAQEDSQFLKFDAIKGPCSYTDFKDAFVIEDSQTNVSAQGQGQVPRIEPFTFVLRCGTTHATAIEQATRGNQAAKLKKAVFTRTVYIDSKRKPILEYTMENLTLKNVHSNHEPGSGEKIVSFTVEFTKLTQSTKDYKKDGTIAAAAGPVVWDFEKGEFQ